MGKKINQQKNSANQPHHFRDTNPYETPQNKAILLELETSLVKSVIKKGKGCRVLAGLGCDELTD